MARETQLNGSLLHLLHRVVQCAGDLFHSEMDGIDLTARQFAVLMAASGNDGLSQRELIERTGIDRSTISQIVRLMVQKGLLQRRRTRRDARAYAVRLTDLGWSMLKTSEPIVSRIDNELIGVLPKGRSKQFLDNLSTIITAFDPARPQAAD